MANLVPSEKRFGRLQYDVVGISPIFFSPASFMIVEVVGQEGHRRDPSSKRGPLLVLDPGSLFFFFLPWSWRGPDSDTGCSSGLRWDDRGQTQLGYLQYTLRQGAMALHRMGPEAPSFFALCWSPQLSVPYRGPGVVNDWMLCRKRHSRLESLA